MTKQRKLQNKQENNLPWVRVSRCDKKIHAHRNEKCKMKNETKYEKDGEISKSVKKIVMSICGAKNKVKLNTGI